MQYYSLQLVISLNSEAKSLVIGTFYFLLFKDEVLDNDGGVKKVKEETRKRRWVMRLLCQIKQWLLCNI
jgi:hypothetical protein